MSQSQLLIQTIAALENASCDYMLTGSLVSSIQGEPRATHDIDIVVDIPQDRIEAFLASFDPDEYYYDLKSARRAVESGSMYNILSMQSGDKVDIWPLGDNEFDQSRFSRKQAVELLGHSVKVSSPEDTILMKLLWSKMSNGSEKQLFDAAMVYQMQSNSLDSDYLSLWIIKLGLENQHTGMVRFFTDNS
jgi:hypothetical protein